MDKQFNKEATRNGESIIRQSQLERAIEIFTLMEVKPSLREILRLSQILTEFQYTWNLNNYELIKFEKHFNQTTNNELLSSVPHTSVDKPLVKQERTSSAYQLAEAKKTKGRA